LFSKEKFIVSTSAVYIGENFKSILESLDIYENLKLHSVFHNVINLDTDFGLLSVVTSKIGHMGVYVGIQEFCDEDFLYLGIDKTNGCLYTGYSLEFKDKLNIDLRNARLWRGIIDSSFRWKLNELKRDNVLVLKAALNIYAKKNSAFQRLYKQREAYFEEAFENLNFNNAEKLFVAVKGLIGFGPGLTPTGDDFLTGFLAVFNSCGDYIYNRKILNNFIFKNLGRTNYISSSMLKNAANNLYHEYIQNLIYSVICAGAEEIINALKVLVGVGATSGSDLACGIYTGFLKALELIGRQGENIAH